MTPPTLLGRAPLCKCGMFLMPRVTEKQVYGVDTAARTLINKGAPPLLIR